AMDHHMWLNAATQENLAILRRRGARILEPVEGALASGATGFGRMQEPEAIVAGIQACFKPGPLAGKRVLVTAGGTQEPIDPVRYVGNRSSGKMGLAVAEEAAARGADVTVVYGAISVPLPAAVKAIHTATAAQMASAVTDLAPGMDAIVMAAAVADYRPAHAAEHKIKRTQDSLTLELEPTETILGAITDLPLVKIGFAAETQNLVENARGKLERSKLDLIVANDVTAEGSGFGTDTNQVVLIDQERDEQLPLISKREVAGRILDRVQGFLASR
ncbi:MAG: bifunctional phosphopantothenoylcysteine decarboxylase/phosphopantothenate--cysteine ligase CoaBC, partial [Chloroflexi bacterium]|nr:bifunctional phosphopantothenoylcysteine decarboxylase/phosphopantothenate--cysteine ligase CoaBC [Chloroflexota bacterium]